MGAKFSKGFVGLSLIFTSFFSAFAKSPVAFGKKTFLSPKETQELLKSFKSNQQKVIDPKVPTKNKGWTWVVAMRYGYVGTTNMIYTQKSLEANGFARAKLDITRMSAAHAADQLTPERLNEIFEDTAAKIDGDQYMALSYVSTLGNFLAEHYGTSNLGSFRQPLEAFKNSFDNESAGQCSDIHFAMLKAYKKIMGPNAKAYLVHYSSGSGIRHTDLIAEDGNNFYVADYGSIYEVDTTKADMLSQPQRAAHGLGYRIYSDDDTTDKQLAYINSPLGKLLREVSVGRHSYNPFEKADYNLAEFGAFKNKTFAIKTFIGQLSENDYVMGIAVNYNKIKALGAGFNFEGYVSGALAYASRKYLANGVESSLNSQILYINTGAAIYSPTLKLGNFSISANGKVELMAAGWAKQYSDPDKTKNGFDGDGNIVGSSEVVAKYKVSKRITVSASQGARTMPTISTSFPQSYDGTGGAKEVGALVKTMNVGSTTLETKANVRTQINPYLGVNVGGVYQYTQLGSLGRAQAGVDYDRANTEFRVNAYLQGAFDREKTPAFVPGARREVGFMAEYCRKNQKVVKRMCAGVSGSKSLEDKAYQGFINLSISK